MRHLSFWSAITLGLALLALSANRSRADCPASTINGVDSTQPADSLTINPGWVEKGAYDLVTGSLSASVAGLCCGGSSDVVARDVYRVVGVPDGQPLDITAELTCSGDGAPGTHGGPEFTWDITSGIQSANLNVQGMFPDRPLQLTIHTTGLAEFPVSWHIHVLKALDECCAEIRGRFRFLNLPEGAQIESCQAYAGGATPNTPSTWGALKARYR